MTTNNVFVPFEISTKITPPLSKERNLLSMKNDKNIPSEGILLVDKQKGKTSFSLVSQLRKITGIKKIGHSGTLDPFASGVMAMLIGRTYTKKAGLFLHSEKEYEALVKLGYTTETLDSETSEELVSDHQPNLEEIKKVLSKHFQGEITQKIPLYSAKKIKGQPLYKLARKGIKIDPGEKTVFLTTTLLDYKYPFLKLHVKCSGGTYIRQVAADIGEFLNTGAYLQELIRLKLGPFHLSDCIKQEDLFKIDITKYLIQKEVFEK